jgi:hypothetical protein
VVVLRVVLEDLGLLMVVEIAGEVVEICFFAPLLAINEPDYSLACIMPREAQGPTSSLKGPHRTFVLARIVARTPVSPVQREDMALRTHKSQSIEALSIAICLQLHSQLVDLGILFWCCVSRVTALFVRGRCWVVVMIVLGIKLHGGVF